MRTHMREIHCLEWSAACRKEEVLVISQILNNNVAVVKKGKNEMIVFSRGISFRKKAGQSIQKSEIEKTYVLDSKDMLEHFSYLLANTKEEYLDITSEIIEAGEKELGQKMSDYLYLTILDHIDFALKRAKKGQFIQSPLAWEVKKFYPVHFEIGLYALQLIKRQFGIEFPEDEAVSIALHFVNIQPDKKNLNETIQAMKVLKDILTIIQYHYRIYLDESSLNYARLVTHLRYLIQRLFEERLYDDNDVELNQQVQTLYPEAYGCVRKISTYVKNSFQIQLSVDEETYLVLHIHRVTNRINREENRYEV